MDLRPASPLRRAHTFTLGALGPKALASCNVERPNLTYKGPAAERDSTELFSSLMEYLGRGSSLLDLGCGPRDQAGPAAHVGMRYVGIDYSSGAADLLADAHAIPFADSTFDGVLSYAVLEHLYNPFVAGAEIARVLKVGGVFVGTVSQGEPFHDSYFHHTSWGLLEVLLSAGFRIERLWHSQDTLRALSVMGRYPAVHRVALGALDRVLSAFPWLAPRKYFRWSERDKRLDALHRGASICFVAVKDRESACTGGRTST